MFIGFLPRQRSLHDGPTRRKAQSGPRHGTARGLPVAAADIAVPAADGADREVQTGAAAIPARARRAFRPLPLDQHRLLVLEDLDQRPAQVSGDSGSLALDDRVGGQGRPVDEERQPRGPKTLGRDQVVDPLDHGVGGIARRRKHLPECGRSRAVREQNEVGERPADVDPDHRAARSQEHRAGHPRDLIIAVRSATLFSRSSRSTKTQIRSAAARPSTRSANVWNFWRTSSADIGLRGSPRALSTRSVSWMPSPMTSTRHDQRAGNAAARSASTTTETFSITARIAADSRWGGAKCSRPTAPSSRATAAVYCIERLAIHSVGGAAMSACRLATGYV